jgi:ATP adenylyltransferase
LDRLWSPWRLQYVIGAKPDNDTGCVFCDAPRRPYEESLVVCQGALCYVVLNKFPYNNGHLMVVPNRHVDTLTALTPAERHEVADLTALAEAALREAYHPQGINAGINLGRPAGAGIVEHLHVHLVPRWSGDANFMTVVGETRVLPETLEDSARRLRPIFEKLRIG